MRRLRLAPICLPLALLAGLTACSGRDDGVLPIAIIGEAADMQATGMRLSPAAQQLRAATSEGLVELDANGDVIPALADRWIVTDDGQSYIFRLREGTWADGRGLTAESVRDALATVKRQLKGTSLARDLAPVSDIRALAGRVVEIRLASPMPDFLHLLAQPELGLARAGGGNGPMQARMRGGVAALTAMPPESRGLPQEDGWAQRVRPLAVRALSAAAAIEAFDAGTVDVVFNGQLPALPLVDTGPLSRGTVRIDPALGLLGLQVRHARGFLAEAAEREALALALDREGLIAPFGIGGWTATTRVVAPDLGEDLGTIGERWQGLSIEQRRTEAAGRVSRWRAAHGGQPVRLTVALPDGPGSLTLLDRLRADFSGIGVALARAPARSADLVLVDAVARYASPRWFLGQFDCSLRRGLCSGTADALVAEALQSDDAGERAALIAEAEAELTAANVYIPFGAPIRFALVRGDINGFAPNSWGFHPLPPLAIRPR